MQSGAKQSENRGNFHSIQVMLGLQQELGCPQHEAIAAVSAALGYGPQPPQQQTIAFGVSSAGMTMSGLNQQQQMQYTTARLRDGFAEMTNTTTKETNTSKHMIYIKSLKFTEKKERYK